MKRKSNHKSKDNVFKKRKEIKIYKYSDVKDVYEGELLRIETLQEGMVILGCVTAIGADGLQMSLPGCLVGKVPFAHISSHFTKALKELSQKDLTDMTLDSVVPVGAVLPCKVIQITQKENKDNSTILLSTDPVDTNSNLRVNSIYKNMILHAAVSSIEDHGCIMDIGIKDIQGFLPFSNSRCSNDLRIGQLIPTCVVKPPSESTSMSAVCLKELSFNDNFPEIKGENIKLSSLLPGATVTASITKKRLPFLYLNCMNFCACVNVMSLSNLKNLAEGLKVSGTILYVHPITQVIYLRLFSKPIPCRFHDNFKLEKFDLVENIRYRFSFQNYAFFSLGKRMFGFLKEEQLQKDITLETLVKNPVIKKARISCLHHVDNLVHLSIAQNFIEANIIKRNELKVAEFCEGHVKEHVPTGMYVSICPGLKGFVNKIHMSDSSVSHAEKLYPIGSKVNCRVLKIEPLSLTCKESFLQMAEKDILQSYKQIFSGNYYNGVIAKKAKTYILVVFFNNVKGIVLNEYISPSSLYYEGQPVNCLAIDCNPVKEKLLLSLMGKLDVHYNEVKAVNSEKASKFDDGSVSTADVVTSLSQPISLKLCPKTPQKAIIQSVSADSINIIINGHQKGRIHITEIGQFEEYTKPIKSFGRDHSLLVYVLGTYENPVENFMEMSHPKWPKCVECSLSFPPPVSLDEPFKTGNIYTGYLKEVNNTYAIVWLSPNTTGILDYLHFTNSPKILRVLKKKLKVGQALQVSVLCIHTSTTKSTKRITLAKAEINIPQVGHNVVGLVEIASIEKGIILKLPHQYYGVVSLTDMKDIYKPASFLLEKLQHLSFLLCHILEVDHKTLLCQVSLRKSRVYQNINKKNIYPEICIQNLEKGKLVKGFIKSVTRKHIVVNIGSNLDGYIRLHRCSFPNCITCKKTEKIRTENVPGSILDVTVIGISKYNKVCLALSQFPALDLPEDGQVSD